MKGAGRPAISAATELEALAVAGVGDAFAAAGDAAVRTVTVRTRASVREPRLMVKTSRSGKVSAVTAILIGGLPAAAA